MDLPLESRFVVDENKKEKIPALDPRLKTDIRFIPYTAPPGDASDRATIEEWLERAGFIEEDLDTLLRLPHDRFWCQVVFDNSLAACIDSYLKLAPRSYDQNMNINAQVKEQQQKLHRLFFFACLRMATHKESKEHFITPKVFGDILYENFIFDIPKLMDLCVLYRGGNSALLTKMICNIFTQQPGYMDDLRATVPTIIHVFSDVAKKCGFNLGSHSASPEKIAESAPNKNKLVSMSDENFQDILVYVSDTAHTLHAFIDIYDQAAEVFMTQEFPIHLVTFYECMSPAVAEAFKTRDWQDLNAKMQLKQIWFKTQVLLAKIFRQILLHNCLRPLLEAGSENEASESIEAFLNLTTAILGERRFVATYDHLFPFREDKDLISQSKYSIDETRLQFIQDGINEAIALYGSRQHKSGHLTDSEETEETVSSRPDVGFLDEATLIAATRDENTLYGAAVGGGGADSEDLGACAPKKTGIELESLISSVKDLLPDLGEGFIELCLEELNYDVEKVINAMLEDKLPESLEAIDRSLKRDKSKIKKEEPSLVEQRLNVFDDDEFDFFRRDQVDKSRIHKGKKTKVSAKDLDDKEYLKSLKPLYDKYGHEFTESAYDDNRDYDDEYDDTYDTNMVGAEDADSADELTNRRPFTVPRVLGLRADARNTGTSGSEELSDGEEERPQKRDEFVQNPAEIRERQEARRAQYAARHGGRPKRDVKGREKGQGQEKDVLRNRAFKEKNKNKNRRAQADKKRAV